MLIDAVDFKKKNYGKPMGRAQRYGDMCVYDGSVPIRAVAVGYGGRLCCIWRGGLATTLSIEYGRKVKLLLEA